VVKPFAAPSFVRTFGLVFLAIVILSVADEFLARLETKETQIEASHFFNQALALMQQGDNAAAIGRIQDAIANGHNNRTYQRTLAEAQLAAGDTAAAESTLSELLQSDSTDAHSNLILARVLAKEGRFDTAVVYYHRAIYGHWDRDQPNNRLHARFELINLLAQRGDKEALLAELLPVRETAPRDAKTRTWLGRLFLQAGSGSQAADVFRGITHDDPMDAQAHAGLGEAEFAQGDYRPADREFQTALRLAPDDQSIRQRLDLSNELLALDPSLRELTPDERFRRSVKLVQLTLDDARQCAGANPSPELQPLLEKADGALKAEVKPAHQSEAAELNLDLAEQLWQARRKDCKLPPAADSPLALVLARLAQ
jgi:Tfp pilus assembly protein PilF